MQTESNVFNNYLCFSRKFDNSHSPYFLPPRGVRDDVHDIYTCASAGRTSRVWIIQSQHIGDLTNHATFLKTHEVVLERKLLKIELKVTRYELILITKISHKEMFNLYYSCQLNFSYLYNF